MAYCKLPGVVPEDLKGVLAALEAPEVVVEEITLQNPRELVSDCGGRM